MILIPCPNCGPRNVAEFHYAGESIPRPDPKTTDQAAWRAYLYLRSNPAGWTTEKWYHGAGCRKFLIVERDTVSNEIRAARVAGRKPAATEAAPEPSTEPETGAAS